MEPGDFIAVGDIFEVEMFPDLTYYRVVQLDPPPRMAYGHRWARCTLTSRSADGTWGPEGTRLEPVSVGITNFMQSRRKLTADEFDVLKILES